MKKKIKHDRAEIAESIVRQSKKVARSYARFENALFKVVMVFSSFIDKVLFNRRYSKLVALVLALLMYMTVNAGSIVQLNSGITSSKSATGVPVTVLYNAETFELSGMPDSVDVTFTGDATSVTSASNADGRIVADLEGLTEGTHNVRLTADGYGNNVDIKIDPSNVTVTLKEKTTHQFDLSYDLVNQDEMEDIYSVGLPDFEYSRVNVRASKDKLDSIAFVKALIDLSGQTADFEQDARLVAYDEQGQVVDVTIIPDTVHVHVPVSSPSKMVAIHVEVTGELAEDLAIESISMDQESATLYGPEDILSAIEYVTVTLDASSITRDTTILRQVTLPAGVSSSSVSQVTLSVKLGEMTSRTISDVPITYRNNTNNYRATQSENKTTTSVTVYGTENNIKDITAEDITVYIDMKDAEPGPAVFALQVEQPSDGLARYVLNETEYQLNIIGEITGGETNG